MDSMTYSEIFYNMYGQEWLLSEAMRKVTGHRYVNHIINHDPCEQNSDHVIHLVTAQFTVSHVQSPFLDLVGPS